MTFYDNKEFWPGHIFLSGVHCDPDLGDITLDQVHGTPFGFQGIASLLKLIKVSYANGSSSILVEYFCI